MTLHTCSPPTDALDRWLDHYPSTDGNYGHILLEQACDCDDDLIQELVGYFESAHGDAREHFHAQLGIDLHPDADAPGAHATYPTCLPSITRRGLFGEVMAGMLTEHYDYIGGHDWVIPVFLFRFHEDAEAYLFALARDEERRREVYGRRGSDFLALALNEDGEIVRFIAGEAKWRKKLRRSVVDAVMFGEKVTDPDTNEQVHNGKGVWFQVNRDIPAPHGLRQLQKLLREIDPEGYSAAIATLDRVLVIRNAEPLPRTNLILLSGGDVPSLKKRTTLIPWKKKPADYTAPHDLQVVELILRDGDEVIDGVYDALWAI
ncbi:aminotransferase [Blastomonas fulva]|uniref:aminotransferase n=1 Tax=Blastomonas fulva TaxID=1550728 RepID=UPI003D273F9C